MARVSDHIHTQYIHTYMKYIHRYLHMNTYIGLLIESGVSARGFVAILCLPSSAAVAVSHGNEIACG